MDDIREVAGRRWVRQDWKRLGEAHVCPEVDGEGLIKNRSHLVEADHCFFYSTPDIMGVVPIGLIIGEVSICAYKKRPKDICDN